MKYKNTDVCVVEHHHHVLYAWSRFRGASTIPHLITLDTHTDLMSAFRINASKSAPTGRDTEEHITHLLDVLVNKLAPVLAEPGPPTFEVLRPVVDALSHDEHIDAAHHMAFIDRTFVILGANACSSTKHPKALVFDEPCLPNCNKKPHDDECLKKHADNLLEPLKLNPIIKKIEDEVGCLTKTPYILDIDLDYFSTGKGAKPSNNSSIQYLIKNADAISVARESDCVVSGRLDGERITSEILLQDIAKLLWP